MAYKVCACVSMLEEITHNIWPIQQVQRRFLRQLWVANLSDTSDQEQNGSLAAAPKNIVDNKNPKNGSTIQKHYTSVLPVLLCLLNKVKTLPVPLSSPS